MADSLPFRASVIEASGRRPGRFQGLRDNGLRFREPTELGEDHSQVSHTPGDPKFGPGGVESSNAQGLFESLDGV